MAAPNFRTLLSKPVDSVKRPPVLPAGTYYGSISEYKFTESKNVNKETGAKTPMLAVTIKGLSPGEDVDQADLKDPADGTPIDMSKKYFIHNFILTENALFRLKEFQEQAGMSTAGRSFEETIPEMKGMPVVLSIVQRPTEDGQNLRNEIAEIKGQPA